MVEESELSMPRNSVSYILQRAFLMNSLALFLHLSQQRENRYDGDAYLMRLGMSPNVERQNEEIAVGTTAR